MLALLPAEWRQQIASSPIAVFLPRNTEVLSRGTLDVQRTAFMLSSSAAGLAVTVRGDALSQSDGSSFAVVDRAGRDGRPAFQLEEIAGRSVMVSQSVRTTSAWWTENGVLYSVELRCTTPTCSGAEYLPRLIASLEFAGGGNNQ
jgi:hypothetical protein